MTKVNFITLFTKFILLDIAQDAQTSANTVLFCLLFILSCFAYGMIKSETFREMVSFFFAGAKIERTLREQVTNAQFHAKNEAVATEFSKVLSGELIVTKSADWWIKRQDDVNLPLKVGDYRLKELPTGVNEYAESDNYSVNNQGINTVNKAINTVNSVNNGNNDTSHSGGEGKEEKMSKEIRDRTEILATPETNNKYSFVSYPYGIRIRCKATNKILVNYPVDDFDDDGGVCELEEYGIILRMCEGQAEEYCDKIIITDDKSRKKCGRCAALSEGAETSFKDWEGKAQSYIVKDNSYFKIDNSCEGFTAKMGRSKGKDCVIISLQSKDKYLVLVEMIGDSGVFLQEDKISVRKCKNPKCNKILLTHNANKTSCSSSCKTTASKLKNSN